MKLLKIFACLFVIGVSGMSETLKASDVKKDWMLDADEYKAFIRWDKGNLVLSNGLVERVFKDGTTIRLNNLMTGEGMLRSVRPEAELEIDQIRILLVGW